MAVGVGVKYQVKYVDDTGTTQVLAQHKTSNTDPDLDAIGTATADRILISRQHQAFDKAKIWSDPSIVGNLPITNSSYDTAQNSQTEPEILLEEWNGSSWDTIFRGFAKSKPSTNNDGQAVFVLKGFGRYTGKQDVDYSAGSTKTIDTVLQEILPNGYTVDAAPAADWPGGSIPTMEDYSIKGERQVAYREISKNYDASIQFTSDLDTGNYVVRLEPVGHGGTVDTIYGPENIPGPSNTLGFFREWQGESTENIINRVEVIGTDSDGNAITDGNGDYPVAEDSQSITDYGVKYKKKNVPYVSSFSEGESIAQNLLKPDPSEGGVVKTPRYVQRVVNSSFQLEDDNNGLSSVYTAVKTRNYLHEQAVELVFEYETGSEAQAENQVETVYERNKVYPGGVQQENVGEQTFDGETGAAPSDTNTTGGVNFQNTNQVPRKALAPIKEGTGTNNVEFNLTAPDIEEQSIDLAFDGLIFEITFANYWNTANTNDATVDWDWQIVNESDADNVVASGSETTTKSEVTNVNGRISTLDVSPGDALRIDIDATDGGFFSTNIDFFHSMLEMEVDAVPTQAHDDNIDTNDNDHGQGFPTDTNAHGASGTTDAKNIDIESTTEEDTGR